MSNVIALAAAGGLAYLAVEDEGVESKRVNPSPTQRNSAATKLRNRYMFSAPSYAGVYDPTVQRDRREDSQGSLGPQELKDRALEKAKEEWDKLDKAGRMAVCASLKDEFPDSSEIQGLECDQLDWEMLVAAAGSVAGAAAGAALCGPACAYVGGIIGAKIGQYLGGELGEYLEEAWDKVEETAEEIWDWATDVW